MRARGNSGPSVFENPTWFAPPLRSALLARGNRALGVSGIVHKTRLVRLDLLALSLSSQARRRDGYALKNQPTPLELRPS